MWGGVLGGIFIYWIYLNIHGILTDALLIMYIYSGNIMRNKYVNIEKSTQFISLSILSLVYHFLVHEKKGTFD